MTLAQCRQQVSFLGDLEGLVGTGLRHETADVNILISESERSLRSMLASNNYSHMLESTAPAPLPTTATVAGDTYTEINWPSDAEGDADAVHGFHVLGINGGSRWVQIFPIDWGQRRYFARGDEYVWALKNLPRNQAGAKVVGKIQIFPLPRGGTYVLDYIPCFPDQTDDADVFVGLPDWHRWRHFDVIVSLLGIRDNDAQGTAAWAASEREKVELRIKAAAPKVKRGGASSYPIRLPRGR